MQPAAPIAMIRLPAKAAVIRQRRCHPAETREPWRQRPVQTNTPGVRQSSPGLLPVQTRRNLMAITVGDFLIERLYQWGVRRIYGYPGDGINGVFGALNRANEKIRFIQARHEEMAAFMA